MKGIHDVFPEDAYDEEDYIYLKKLKKQEAQWNLEKGVLGFHFDGIEKKNMVGSQKTWRPIDHDIQVGSRCKQGTTTGWH